MKSYTVETYVGERDATVTFDFYPGKLGVYSGPPEKCYEDEPDDLEVTRVVIDGNEYQCTEAELEELTNRMCETGWQLIAEDRADECDYREVRASRAIDAIAKATGAQP
jgi:hypothetical protein